MGRKILLGIAVILCLTVGITVYYLGDSSPSEATQEHKSGCGDGTTVTLVSESIIFEETTISLPGGVPLVLVKIPKGSFIMGSPDDEQERNNIEEGPLHEVTIPCDFYMGIFEITQSQWFAVMGTKPWSAKTHIVDLPDMPAVCISWNDINGSGGFLEKLNEHLVATEKIPATFRLPTEAEWEYACRAGTSTRFYWGDDPDYTEIGKYACWKGNKPKLNHPLSVGQKLPNAWGLYDMSGNVMEWCQDRWHKSYEGAPTDGSAWEDGNSSERILRVGGWYYDGRCFRSSIRYKNPPDITHYSFGFRLVRCPLPS